MWNTKKKNDIADIATIVKITIVDIHINLETPGDTSYVWMIL